MIFNVQCISLINFRILINSLPNSPAIIHYHKCQLNSFVLIGEKEEETVCSLFSSASSGNE